MSRLFVIESPTKARTMEALLGKLGLPARVQATVGHIFEMPKSLGNIGIDRAFRDFERKPRDVTVVERLRSEVQIADEVFVATDADAEGDVIAWDVATLIADICPNPRRVKLRGMDAESVQRAVAEAGPVLKHDAVSGRTRAIVDRLIGAGFSRDGVAVGRVSTALLGLVARHRPSTKRLTLVAPAEDNGRPWSAERDVSAPMDDATAEGVAGLSLPPLKYFAVTDIRFRPGHMGDIMVRAGDRLDMSPKETATAMQNLFEGGRISYPRSGARGITPDVARRMQEVLRKRGYKVEDGKFPVKADKEVHDAPHPIGAVDPERDPTRLGHDEGVRTMMARDLVRCAQTHREEKPTSMSLVPFLQNRGYATEVADWVAAMPWRREVGPGYPGKRTHPESGVQERRADVVLLERAVESGLGRPSTWARHIDTFMSRGLVDDGLNLTSKGRAWVAASPPDLLDPRVSAIIEKACDDVRDAFMTSPDREPWELNAERIVKALPPAVRGVCEGLIANEPPRPKVDPVREYGLSESAMAAAEAASAHVNDLAPRPRAEY